MVPDAGDDGLDRQQLDVVVRVDSGLVGGAERMSTMWAGVERRFDGSVRTVREGAGCVRAAEAKPAGTTRMVWFLTFGRRHARIVRCLRRHIQPGFEFTGTLEQYHYRTGACGGSEQAERYIQYDRLIRPTISVDRMSLSAVSQLPQG